MATKLIPGQWYDDDNDGTRMFAVTGNDVAYRDGEGVLKLYTFRDGELAKLTHRPDCDGWDWQPPKPPLRVEVGKTYRCRNGKTTKVVGDSPHRKYPFLAENGFTYMSSGRWHLESKSRRDLIEEIPEPEPDYIDIHKASGLKVGDMVRIEKKTEPKGWGTRWTGGMSAKVGAVGTINHDGGADGFHVTDESKPYWYYPATSLTKVEPKWRAFANQDEAEPFFDRLLRAKDTGAIYRITSIGARGLHAGLEAFTYDEAFEYFEFLDGTPFGIKVLE